MTKEEAISKVKGYLTDYLPSDNYEEVEEIIKALEQEPTIDKIRAEIEKLQKMCDKNDLNLMAQYSAFGMVLDFIDKLKGKSEGRNDKT